MKNSYTPRALRGSKYFDASNTSTILANGVFTFTLDERFKPYNEVIVVNLNTENDCKVKVNWGHEIILPKSNSITIDIPTENLEVISLGSTTIAVGEIKIQYRALPQVDKRIATGFKIIDVAKTIGGLL